MYEAKSGVKNFSLYWGGGGSLDKNFFSQSEHVWSQIWCQKFFPLLRLGTPPPENLGPPENLRPGTPPPRKSETWEPPQKSETLDPPQKSETWDPPPKIWDLDLGPPPPKVWTDTQAGVKTLPSLVLRTRAVMMLMLWYCLRRARSSETWEDNDVSNTSLSIQWANFKSAILQWSWHSLRFSAWRYQCFRRHRCEYESTIIYTSITQPFKRSTQMLLQNEMCNFLQGHKRYWLRVGMYSRQEGELI